MRVILSFDVEVWCDGWSDLDARFPGCFDHYIYGVTGKSPRYGLQTILEMLNKHNLHGVFFVEPLFSARFGKSYLETIVSMILKAGQEVQLHLHPEWVDEIRPSFIPNCPSKRPMLASYSLTEQTSLIEWGAELLQEAGAPKPAAFRAGNFGANRATLTALAKNDIWLDSSFNGTYGTLSMSRDELGNNRDLLSPFLIDGVRSIPVSIFKDFRGRLRHAQLAACSFGEFFEALSAAQGLGKSEFVILAHNFEMINRQRKLPNWIVVERFRKLCVFLESSCDTLPTGSFSTSPWEDAGNAPSDIPRVSALTTLNRYWEQLRQLQ